MFEQAIGAAHRAGITDDELEAGAITFGLWGAGFTKLDGFDYLSYEGLRVHITVIGGENSCATGTVLDNLIAYSVANANTDASDLYARIQTWLAAHPATAPRDVVVASHSWGGAVAEYLAFHLDAIAGKAGPLPGATMPFTIAAGVPGFIPSYTFAGPGMRPVGDNALYEIDRPDDPVHAVDPSGNPDGHQYDILFGDDYQGSYGVTTEAISCRGVPGPCSWTPARRLQPVLLICSMRGWAVFVLLAGCGRFDFASSVAVDAVTVDAVAGGCPDFAVFCDDFETEDHTRSGRARTRATRRSSSTRAKCIAGCTRSMRPCCRPAAAAARAMST